MLKFPEVMNYNTNEKFQYKYFIKEKKKEKTLNNQTNELNNKNQFNLKNLKSYLKKDLFESLYCESSSQLLQALRNKKLLKEYKNSFELNNQSTLVKLFEYIIKGTNLINFENLKEILRNSTEVSNLLINFNELTESYIDYGSYFKNLFSKINVGINFFQNCKEKIFKEIIGEIIINKDGFIRNDNIPEIEDLLKKLQNELDNFTKTTKSIFSSFFLNEEFSIKLSKIFTDSENHQNSNTFINKVNILNSIFKLTEEMFKQISINLNDKNCQFDFLKFKNEVDQIVSMFLNIKIINIKDLLNKEEFQKKLKEITTNKNISKSIENTTYNLLFQNIQYENKGNDFFLVKYLKKEEIENLKNSKNNFSNFSILKTLVNILNERIKELLLSGIPLMINEKFNYLKNSIESFNFNKFNSSINEKLSVLLEQISLLIKKLNIEKNKIYSNDLSLISKVQHFLSNIDKNQYLSAPYSIERSKKMTTCKLVVNSSGIINLLKHLHNLNKKNINFNLTENNKLLQEISSFIDNINTNKENNAILISKINEMIDRKSNELLSLYNFKPSTSFIIKNFNINENEKLLELTEALVFILFWKSSRFSFDSLVINSMVEFSQFSYSKQFEIYDTIVKKIVKKIENFKEIINFQELSKIKNENQNLLESFTLTLELIKKFQKLSTIFKDAMGGEIPEHPIKIKLYSYERIQILNQMIEINSFIEEKINNNPNYSNSRKVIDFLFESIWKHPFFTSLDFIKSPLSKKEIVFDLKYKQIFEIIKNKFDLITDYCVLKRQKQLSANSMFEMRLLHKNGFFNNNQQKSIKNNLKKEVLFYYETNEVNFLILLKKCKNNSKKINIHFSSKESHKFNNFKEEIEEFQSSQFYQFIKNDQEKNKKLTKGIDTLNHIRNESYDDINMKYSDSYKESNNKNK
jgi:hypothetical protein